MLFGFNPDMTCNQLASMCKTKLQKTPELLEAFFKSAFFL